MYTHSTTMSRVAAAGCRDGGVDVQARMAVQVHSYVRIQVLDFLPNYEHRNLRSDPHQSCLVVALRPDGRRQNENRKWRKSMCWGLIDPKNCRQTSLVQTESVKMVRKRRERKKMTVDVVVAVDAAVAAGEE